jgi:hypothetical protein
MKTIPLKNPTRIRRSVKTQMITVAFDELSDAGKLKLYADADAITPLTPGKPMTRYQRATWVKAKRKMGRPVVGRGHKVISTSIEAGLLKRVDAFAKRQGLTRAALIAEGLQTMLQRAG